MKSKQRFLKHLSIWFICILSVFLFGFEPETILPDFQINDLTETNFSHFYPVTGVAANGDYVVTWQDWRTSQKNIYAQRFSSDGTALGKNILVNDDTKKNNRAHFPPTIAVAANGDFIIVWADNRVSVTAPYRLRFQRYDKDGQTLGVNEPVDANVLSGYTQHTPEVAYADSGHVIIVWHEALSGGFTDIAMRKLDDQGECLGGIVMVNDNEIDLIRQHAAIACNSSGSYLIAWQDYSIDFNWGDIHYKRFNSNDSQVGDEIRANDDPKNEMFPQRDAAVALNDSGDFIICWKDGRNDNYDIFAQRYNADGDTLGVNFKVDDDPDSLDQQNPDVEIKSDGGCLITWSDNRNDGEIYAQLIDEEGEFLSNNFLINDVTTGMQSYPNMGIDDSDNFVITWQDNRNSSESSDAYSQKILSAGTPIGANNKITDDSWNNNQKNPHISAFSNGGKIVCWSDYKSGKSDIYAQVYDAANIAVGENFQINGENSAAFPDVAAGDDNRVLAVWVESANMILGQMITADGSLSGGLLNIDTLVGGSGHISVDYNNGTYIVAWHESLPPDYGNIFARRLDSDGLPLGPAFKVNNDNGTDTQDKPAIAINDEGEYIIVWQDTRDNGWPKVYAQLFNSDGETVNNNFKINHSLTDSLFLFYLPCVAATDSGHFAVVYRTSQQDVENNLNIRFLDPEGTYIGSSIRLNDESINDLYWKKDAVKPAVTAGDSSRIFVTWEDSKEDENYYLKYFIRGQRLIFNSKVDSNFYVADNIGSDQHTPAVYLLGRQILTAWEDNREEIIANDIWANILDFGAPLITDISELSKGPSSFILSQNYPNPFNPNTVVSYQLPVASKVEITVYNLLGQKIWQKRINHQSAGQHEINVDLSNYSSGAYFYRLEAGNFVQTRKMVMLK